MAKYVINDATLTGIANAIRDKIGSTEPILTDEMAEKITSISQGIDTSDATVTEIDMPMGVTGYAKGKKVTGNTILIESDAFEDGLGPVWAEDTGSLRVYTRQGMRYMVEANVALNLDIDGYKLGDAEDADVREGKTYTSASGLKRTGTKTDPVEVEQAVPVFAANLDAGIIGAICTQAEGYVRGGTTFANIQLDTIGEQTITPSTSDQTLPSRTLLTGRQTIKGDAKLIPENIKKGVSIFNVIGAFEGEGGGGLPEGFSAFASGTITPTTNSSYLEITHNFGFEPNFIAWFAQNETSNSPIASTATMGASLAKESKASETSSTIYYMTNLIAGYNVTPQFSSTTTRSSINYMTSTTARMIGSTTYYLRAGQPYRWFCGYIDGVL